jgi:hypothetical protein
LTVAGDVADGAGNRMVILSGVARTGLAVGDRITVNFPSAASYNITGDEVAGVTGVDRQSTASGSAGAFSSGATGTIGRPGEFVFGAVAEFGGTTLSWDAGWRGLTTYAVGTKALGRAYQIPGTVGSFTASGTAAGQWLAAVVSFT